jgi:peroxiredoxin
MKKALRFGVLFLYLLSCPSQAGKVQEAVIPGSSVTALRLTLPQQRLVAPDFNLLTPAGQPLQLFSFSGKLILLNFWASYCAPCREEMPALERLWKKYQQQGLVVLAVAADAGDASRLVDYLQSMGYTFPVVLDSDAKVRQRYEVQALPTTYIIGRDGRFVGRVLGARDWYSQEAKTLVQALLLSDIRE